MEHDYVLFWYAYVLIWYSYVLIWYVYYAFMKQIESVINEPHLLIYMLLIEKWWFLNGYTYLFTKDNLYVNTSPKN